MKYRDSNTSSKGPEISMSHGLRDKRALAEVSGQQPGERILHKSEFLALVCGGDV